MKVVIVGSRDLWPTSDVVSSVAAAMGAMGDEGTVRYRMNWLGETHSPTEALVRELASHGGLANAVGYRPFRGRGRQKVYNRDWDMVRGADRVIAYFAPEAIMEGGTGHVVHAAIVGGVPIEAYTLDDSGRLLLVGSEDHHDVGRALSASEVERLDSWFVGSTTEAEVDLTL